MLTLRMAWRNVWRNPRRTGVVVSAVAIGIAGALVTVALNYGLVLQMLDTAIATEVGHVQVHAAGWAERPELAVRLRDGGAAAVRILERTPGVRSFSRRVRGEGLVSSPRASAGVRVLGVEPEREISSVMSGIRAGGDLRGVRRRLLLGEELARRLQVEVGDKVVLSVQELPGDLVGEALRVGGLFRTASSAFDRGTVLLRLPEAQALFGLGEAVSEVAVLARTRADVGRVRDALAAGLPDAEARSWDELQPLLVYLIETFDQQAAVVYTAVFVAMAFGIANVLLMAVSERVREIGILLAIGASRARIVASIVLEGLVVTGVGVALGFGIAAAGVLALQDGIDLSLFAEGLLAWGIGTRIVPVLRPADLWLPAAIAAATALGASAWPALRAARFRPAEAVRRI